MAIVRKFQNNFTTGLVSPGVMARTDLQKYAASCTRLLNAIVLPQGGATKRPGTSGTAVAVDEDSFLFPFQYNEDEGYVLVFVPATADPETGASNGDGMVRVSRRGGMASAQYGGAEISGSPYLAEDLPRLKFIQSNDVVFIAHPKYALRTLKRTIEEGAVVWKLEKASIGASNPLAVSGVGVSKSGFTPDAAQTDVTYGVSVVTEDGSEGPVVEKSTSVDASWPSGAKVTVTWNEPKDMLRIAYTGTSADVAGDYRRLSKTYNGKAVWQRTSGSADRFVVYRRTGTRASYRGYYACVSEWASGDGVKDGDYRYFSGEPGENANEVMFTRVVVDGILKLYDTDWTIPGAPSGDTPPHGTKVPGDDVSYYNVYKDEGQGWGLVGAVEKPKFVDNNIQPDTSAGPKSEYVPFGTEDGGGDNPGAVSIMQQRLVCARTDERVGTMWLSETGSLLSFGKHRPLIASDSIEATLDSLRANEIRHLFPMRYGLVFTSGAEYMLSAGRNSEAISPTSISISLQSMWGSSHVPPLCIGSHVLFVQPDGLHIRDMAYEYTADGFVGQEVTILVQGVLDSPIRDWAYHRDPWNCVWIVLENGRLFSLTYMHEQQVYAFAEHATPGGSYRSVCVVREDGRDRAYFLVARDYEFTSGKFAAIERMADPFIDGDVPENYIDLSVRLQLNPGSSTREVTCYGYGAPIGSLCLVADGRAFCGQAFENYVGEYEETGLSQIPVPEDFPGGYVYTGICYPMVVETADPELTADNGPVVADPRSVAELELIVRDTGFLKAGWDEGHLETVKLPMQKAYPAPPGAPPEIPLHTGKVRLPLAGNYRDRASVTLVSDRPVPCTVLAVNAKISIG